MTSPARATALLTAAVSLLMADFTFAAVRPTRATLISPRHYSDTRQPTYVWVLNPTEAPVLTLVTCYPFRFIGAAQQRIIVRALLTSS